MEIYPINPRDENQFPLPHGEKALLIAVSSFLLMVAILVGLLHMTTSGDMRYAKLGTEAAYEKGLFGLLSYSMRDQRVKNVVSAEESEIGHVDTQKEQATILTRLYSIEERLRMLTDQNDVDVPIVNLKADF